MKSLIAAALVLFVLNATASADWGGVPCEPVGSPSASSPSTGYQWEKYAPGEFYLLLNGRQIGALRAKGHVYFALQPDKTFRAAECPCELPSGVCRCPGGCVCPPDSCQCDTASCPCQAKAAARSKTADAPLCGVDRERVEASKGKHIHNGREVTRQAVLEALQKASVPSDQNKLRLTLIGQKDATDAILGDLKAIPDAADLLIMAYPPDHWAVKDSGLAAGKPFSIVLQSPDGKVLHRQWDYAGGAAGLAEALRSARADYNPAADPDHRQNAPLSALWNQIKAVPAEWWLVTAAFASLLIRRKD